MADDNDDDKSDFDDRVVPHDQYTWRAMVMRDLRTLDRRINRCVTKEMFEAKVGPIQKVMWLIFSVVTSALVTAVIGLVVVSGKVIK